MNYKERIRKAADRMVDHHEEDWNMNMESFDWVPAVGLYGVFEAYRATGDQKYLDYLKGWSDRHLGEAYQQKTVNSIAPMLTMLSLYQETGDERLKQTAVELAEYVINEAPRTVDGGLEHTVTEPVPGFSDQV